MVYDKAIEANEVADNVKIVNSPPPTFTRKQSKKDVGTSPRNNNVSNLSGKRARDSVKVSDNDRMVSLNEFF
tara:strand:+ start:414 stop:629 length:216 start_codon:yes stop_codon:yes gene_type:complete